LPSDFLSGLHYTQIPSFLLIFYELIFGLKRITQVFVSTCSILLFLGGEAQRGKAIPLQSWTGPEGSRGLKIQDFKAIGT
jgi:hypothetical protein